MPDHITINSLFVKGEISNTGYTGVRWNGSSYMARLKKYDKTVYLGCFNTPEKAYDAYKIAKEKYIKEVANLYKQKIPNHIHEILINYIV